MALVKKQNASGWYYEGDSSDFNLNKGITTGLDSSATKKPQPSGNMNAGDNKINGANPSSPSTNNATRREQYNLEYGTSDIPESTKIGQYATVSSVTPKSYYPQTQETTEDYLGAIKKLPGFSYYTTDFDNQLREVEAYINEQGIDASKEMYGSMLTEAAQQLATLNMQQGQLKAQENQVTNKQASNAKLVYTLAKEVWSGLAQGQTVQQIAQKLGQDERVIQKIANNETEELVQLNAEYEEEQLRTYLRNREDMDIQIARNITQYNNLQKNLDYQFDSAMETLRRNLFDAEWTAKGTSAGLGMTGTEYVLNRIQAQYDQQMGDIKNTYDYQSANAQIAINEALEDYSKNLQRRAQDYAQARKGIQGYALQSLMNIENNIGLTADQMASALTTAYKNIQAAQSSAMQDYLSAIENKQSSLAKQIAEAYGLSDLTSVTTTGGGKYTPSSQESVDGALYTITSSTSYANGKKIRSGECGTIVNDYLGMIGAGFKISYASDMEKYINYRGTDPAVGSIVYFAPGSLSGMSEGGKKFGHVAIVTGVNKEKGTITVRESNASTGIRTHEYNMSDVYGYFEPAQGYSSTEDGTDYSEYDSEVNDKYNILSTLKTELEAVDFDQNRKKLAKQNGEWNNIKSLDAFETLWNGGIRTMGALFSQAVDADAKYHSEALQIISGAPKTMGALDTVVTDFARIYNKNFIDYLINAKGEGATFGNLTEGEGFKILTAANEMSAWMSQDDLLNRINNAIQLIEKRKKKNQSTVTPQLPQNSREANDVLGRISSTMGSGFGTGTNGYSTGPTVNTTFTNTTFTK